MHLAPLIKDLAIILAAAAIVGFLFQRLRQPIILGYLIAGILVGPSTSFLGGVTDLPSVRTWGELGVVFLMFTLGLDFSFRRLATLGVRACFTGVFEISCLLAAGFALGRAFGWSNTQSLFLGGTVAISSTTIIMKGLENLNLRRRRFADGIFGILIVEDLLAILILVALSSLMTRGEVEGWGLLMILVRLLLIIGSWMLVGLFLVPRFLKIVARSGNDELMMILALGLCLILVVFATRFGFSPALGAFIMGSIIAETREARRIEELVRPLKDLFGAIFFVSIGMLVDPSEALSHIPTIFAVTALVIVGKSIFITAGSLLSGQSLQQATQTGLSMTQIGEFSFIIASLAITYGVAHESFSTIIVAVAVLTTFTTPFLIRSSARIAARIEAALPENYRNGLEKYAEALNARLAWRAENRDLLKAAFVWTANGILTTAVFSMSDSHLKPLLDEQLMNVRAANAVAWLLTILATSPFTWAMSMSFRNSVSRRTEESSAGALVLLLSRVLTVLWVGVLSLAFLSPLAAFIITGLLVAGLVVLFYSRLEASYRWIEEHFIATLRANSPATKAVAMERLAPWTDHLMQLNAHPDSEIIGQTLIEARLRERFGLNIVAIQRGSRVIVAPSRHERIFPNDELLVLANDEQIEAARGVIEGYAVTQITSHDLSDFDLKPILVTQDSSLCGKTILNSRLRERYGALVVGIERERQRTINPPSHFLLQPGDMIWIVGDRIRLREL